MAASTQDTDDASPSTPGLRLATIGGVPVYIGKSWWIIVLIIMSTFGPQVASSRPDLGPAAYAVALAYAGLLLLVVLAHEAAHAVVATRAGYLRVKIVADLIGGHTSYDAPTTRPGASALVAIAGPAANALLAVVVWLALPSVPDGIPYLLAGAMLFINASLAALNMLPGLPLDGGVLVESLVWRITGSRESGLITAGWCGRVVTVLVVLGFVGLPLLGGDRPSLLSLVWTLFIGSFLWMGATNAIRAGRGGRLLAGIRIDSVWRPAASLPAHATAAQALDLRNSGPGAAIVVIEDDGRNAIGLVDDEALEAIPKQSVGTVPVTSLMRAQPDGWVVEATADQSVAIVVQVIQRLRIGAVGVRGGDGRINGIVLVGDLEAALSRRPPGRT